MLKPRDKKYMVADGERLFIMVMPLTGTQTECTKRWVSRVRFQGRDLDIGLGLWPEVSIAEAQFDLGCMYYKGQDIPQNFEKARELYAKAAAQGHAPALHNLAVLYFDGAGVQQDHAKARALLEQAAAQGDADSQYFLGSMLAKGEGGPQDWTQARKWIFLSATQGHPGTQLTMGSILERGDVDVPRDIKAAKEWYARACAGGVQQACEACRRLESAVF